MILHLGGKVVHFEEKGYEVTEDDWGMSCTYDYGWSEL